MSIASEISRITGNIADAYTAANSKGATMPVTQNSDNLASTIATISSGVTPTGTLQITQNGLYDVTNYANVDVQTSVPTYYIEKTVDSTGTLIPAPGLIDLTGVKNIGDHGLAYAYYNSTYAFGALDLSSIEHLTNSCGMQYAFYNCNGITSVDMSNLLEAEAANCLQYAFANCSNLVTADLSSLLTIGDSAWIGSTASHIFESCPNLVSVDLSSLKAVGGGAMWTSTEMFRYCTSLTTVKLDSLEKLNGTAVLAASFSGCTSLTELRLPSLKTVTTSSISRLTEGTTGVTVHFPSNLSTVITASDLGGTNTTVLYDLPPTT